MKVPVSAKDDAQKLCAALMRLRNVNKNFGPFDELPQEAFETLPGLAALAQGPDLSNAFVLHEAAHSLQSRPLDEVFAFHSEVETALLALKLHDLAEVYPRLRNLLETTPAQDFAVREDNSREAQSPQIQAQLDALDAQWDTARAQVDMARLLHEQGAQHGWDFVAQEAFDEHWIARILSSDRYREMAQRGGPMGGVTRKVFDGFTERAMQEKGLVWQFDLWRTAREGGAFALLGHTPSGPVWHESDPKTPTLHRFTRFPDGAELAVLNTADLVPPLDPGIARESKRLHTASNRLSRAAAWTKALPLSDEISSILAPRGMFGYAYYLGGMGCSNGALLRALRALAVPLAVLVVTWFGPVTVTGNLEALAQREVGSFGWVASLCFVVAWAVVALAALPKLAGTLGLFFGTLARGLGRFPRFDDNLPGTGQSNVVVTTLERLRGIGG